MKKSFFILTALIISTAAVFCAKSKGRKTMLQTIRNADDVRELFPQSAQEIKSMTDEYIKEAQAVIDAIIAIPQEQRTYANTIKALDELESLSNLAILGGLAEVIQYTNPDEVMRNAAQEAAIKIQGFAVDTMANNIELYDAIQSYAQHQADKESLTAQEKYYLDKTIKDFKRNGLDLPQETLNKIKILKKDLAALQIDFESNIAKDASSIHVTRQELAGLSDEFINALKKTEDGLFVLGVDYPTFYNVMDNCSVESTRKKLDTAFGNRAYPANQKVLEDVIAKRHEMATLLGYKSFADYDLGDQMVQSIERAEQFIFPLLEKAHGKEKQEFDEMIADLPEGISLTESGQLKSWDSAYVKNYFKKKHYKIDEELIAEYFPMEKTIQGLFDVYEKFLTLKLKEITAQGFWHEDVKLIEVCDAKDNTLIGYLLLDLYPRANKFSHACHAGIIPSTYIEGKKNFGVSVVIANFPKSTAQKPSLLKRKDVSTFFHEFGHALHSKLGRTHIASLAGTSVKRDFVELPSQMLEEWLNDKEILKQVSGHYKTGQPLPDEMIESILKVKNFGSGKFLQSQLFYSQLALDLFKDGANKNVFELFKSLYIKNNKNVAFDHNNHMYASFGHLMGYGAKYYGYMWSKVFALDLFDTIRKEGLLNPVIGQKYVAEVIGKGGSEDPNDLLKNFLGREPNQEAFLCDLGLVSDQRVDFAMTELKGMPTAG